MIALIAVESSKPDREEVSIVQISMAHTNVSVVVKDIILRMV